LNFYRKILNQFFVILAISIASSNGIILQCGFRLVEWMLVDSISYTCRGNIFNAGNELIIRGNHTNGRNNSHVVGLQIFGQDLLQIPQGLGENFPHLKGVQIERTNLTSISVDDLKQFPNILQLKLDSTHLKSLDGDLLTVLPHLRQFDFDNNLLQHVGHNLLAWSSELQGVSFGNNPCINQGANGMSAISNLNRLLPLNCPPLATPTTKRPTTTTTLSSITSTPGLNECPENCSDRLDFLEEKISLVVAENRNYESRIAELEKRMREISADPCTRA
jgi:hypothetical protein